MAIVQRPYTSETGFSTDFFKVRDFIRRINHEEMTYHHFMWGRWTWAFALPYLDKDNLDKMQLWEEDGRIFGAVVFEEKADVLYLIVDSAHDSLKKNMLDFVDNQLVNKESTRVLIDNNDRTTGAYARQLGFKPIEWFEENSVLDIDVHDMNYTLPAGYKLINFNDEYDVKKHNACMWSGFNHVGNPPEAEEDLLTRQRQVESPDQDKSLLIAAVAPNGDYVAYCGMWHMEGDYYAEVEPVCTHSDHRKLGLGKAVVLEGVKRCGLRGAKVAYVGSKQQFYYNIGFNPVSTGTMWEKKVD